MKTAEHLLLFFVSSSCIYPNNAQNLETASLIGGKEDGNVRYLVSLQLEDEHFCGGSIIGDRHILTAAHCVIGDDNEFEKRPIKIVAGAVDLRNNDSTPAVVVADVDKVYVPRNYNDTEWTSSIPAGDIAVIRLKQSLDHQHHPNLQKLRLPRSSRRGRSKYRSYAGESVLISGFGWDRVKVNRLSNETEYEVGSSSDRLYSASAQVLANKDCQEYYANPILPTELCAKVIEHDDDTPQGVCRGDSGGPLVYRSSTVIGVVSGISIGCNENNEPGIYTRVSSHLRFVRNALRDVVTDGMRTKTYTDKKPIDSL